MAHDIGKATPAFACQVEVLADQMRLAGLDMPHQRQMPDRKLAPHGLAGQVLLQEWLVDRYGWSRSAALQFAVVAGSHHGIPPTHSNIQALNVHPDLLRTHGCESVWKNVQHEILDRAAVESGVEDRLADWAKVKLPQPVQVLLTGLVIVADWIASNADLFPYFPEAGGTADGERIKAAWSALDLPELWQGIDPTEEPADLFAARFDFPPGSCVRPVQERAVRLARSMPAPGPVQRRADGLPATVPWLAEGHGGVELPTDVAPEQKVARIIGSCGLRLSHHFSIPATLDRAIEELEEEYLPAWQTKECYWLAGELILTLDENCRRRLAGYELRYSSADGLEVTRHE